MAKLPFKVSARTARLIGRENVATADGAVTELVKNAYDADASICAVLFVPKYKRLPKEVTSQEFEYLEGLFPAIAGVYEPISKTEELATKYTLGRSLSKAAHAAAQLELQNYMDIWILDNGHGMTRNAIEDNWMVIGTSNKAIDVRSRDKKRRVSGAKGIGRFALDRLGAGCHLISQPSETKICMDWVVDWRAFEGSGKNLSDIYAILEEQHGRLEDSPRFKEIRSLLPKHFPAKKKEKPKEVNFPSGTALQISQLSDRWLVDDVEKLRNTLEALIPPLDQSDFNILVYDHRDEDGELWVAGAIPSEFDYHMAASVKEDGVVSVTLRRQEIDFGSIREITFDLDDMKAPGYCAEDLKKGIYSYETSLSKLFRRTKKEGIDDLLAIGPFEFNMYFFKLINPSKKNLKKYPQKTFNATKRREWIERSGGIRIYRDDFRVRPYGEPDSSAADWLLLGRRVAANPAAASRKGWRVPPQQLAGTIQISHEKNPLLEDRSNRDGIADDRAFRLFADIVVRLIGEFEYDRSRLFGCFEEAYNIENPAPEIKSEGKRAARKIRGRKSATTPTGEAQNVVAALEVTESENAELVEENKLLRGMATLGTVLVSFTHELKQLKADMGKRNRRMSTALGKTVDAEKLSQLSPIESPYRILENWEKDDEKVSHWIEFALSSVTSHKRTQKEINLREYFDDLEERWSEYLATKSSTIKINTAWKDDVYLTGYEIDLDSVFYNLIVNSFEAFSKKGSPKKRAITIDVVTEGSEALMVSYSDTGPGLGDYYDNPNDIFAFGETSKLDGNSEQKIGTGLGMWILKSIVDDYGGMCQLREPKEPGFRMSIRLPLDNDESDR